MPLPTIRAATRHDVPELDALIAESARALSGGFYSAVQIEAAIAHVFGVDSELVADGTYLVAELDDSVAGCGGWSKRATLFGGDHFAGRESGLLDPACDAAKIRAFFVSPRFARSGIGSAILDACEGEAAEAQFKAAELMATLPGVPFYAARGYAPAASVDLDLDGVAIRFMPMRKPLDYPVTHAKREIGTTTPH